MHIHYKSIPKIHHKINIYLKNSIIAYLHKLTCVHVNYLRMVDASSRLLKQLICHVDNCVKAKVR